MNEAPPEVWAEIAAELDREAALLDAAFTEHVKEYEARRADKSAKPTGD